MARTRKRRVSIKGRGAEILFGNAKSEESSRSDGAEDAPELTELFPGDHEPAGTTADGNASPGTAPGGNDNAEVSPSPTESSATSATGEAGPTSHPAEAGSATEDPASNGEWYRDWRRRELGVPVDPSPAAGQPDAADPPRPDGTDPATSLTSPAAGPSDGETGDKTGTGTTVPDGLSPAEAQDFVKAVSTLRTLLPDIGTPEESPSNVETVPLTDQDMRRARRRVTRAMLESLDSEVDALYKRVRNEVSSDRRIANRCLRLLHEARQVILVAPGRYADAELKIEEVRIILRQAENSEKGAHSSARLIFLYGVGWFLLLLVLLVMDQALANWFRTGPLQMVPMFPEKLTNTDGTLLGFSMVYYFLPWLCMLWGGIGGVVGSLYSLRWYVSRRQYDVEHNLSYLAHPIMGVILGGVVYFLFRAGFFALQAAQANLGNMTAVEQILTAQSPVLILISILAGFKQKFVYEMLDRVMRAILRVDVEGEPDMTKHGSSTPTLSGDHPGTVSG
ncbi:MAG: hypothetical protein GXP41_12405 [Chloroflexi bacterium]|nr:hypothetical protein [Chloroflexota bacterium]